VKTENSVENLPELRQRMHQITQNYWNAQQDILENAGCGLHPGQCPL